MTTPLAIRSPPTFYFNYLFPRSWTNPDLFPENHPRKQNNTTILPKNEERVQMLPQKRNKEVIFCFKSKKFLKRAYNLKQCSKIQKKRKCCLAQPGHMWCGCLRSLVNLSGLHSSFFRWSCQCFCDSVHWVYWRYRRDQYGACIFHLTFLVTVNLDFAPFYFATTAFFRSMGSSLKDHSDGNEKVRHLYI